MNANEEFCSVFKISIGAMRIILAAEMDCAMALGPDDEQVYKNKLKKKEEVDCVMASLEPGDEQVYKMQM